MAAGLLGEGGIATLSGTASATAPILLASFGSGDRYACPDGSYINAYTVDNPDTSGSYLVCVQVAGLHTTNATSGNFATVYPGTSKVFQFNERNSLSNVWAFGRTTGNATTNSTITVSGAVMIRK